MAERVTQRITELVVGDDPEAWQAAGFTVDGSACRVGEVMVRLAGSAGDRGIRSWTLAGVDLAGRHDIDGVPSEPSPTADEATAPAAGAEHPNGTTRIDHVVLVTPDLGRTVDALATVGLELRRTRDTDSPESPMRQAFFRIGEVILEVVGPPEPSDDGPSRWYGLAFAVDDLDALVDRLGEHVGAIKPAVQRGRRITTLRHRELGLSVATAFMDDPVVP